MDSFEYSSSLGNVKPRINDAIPYQTFVLDFQTPPDSKAPNLLKLEFSLILREALNYCLKKTADVFKVWLNNRCVSVSLQTRQGQYSLNSKNYLIYLNPTSNISTDTTTLHIDESKSQPRSLYIKATFLIHQQGQDMTQLLKMREIFVELGSQDKSTVAQTQIASLTISVIKIDSPPIPKENLIFNRFQFYDSCNILPLGVIKSVEQIYASFGLSASPSIKYIENYINKLPPYSAIPFTKDNKLFLCHDMKGGYKQDINFDNTLTQKKNPTYFYRNMYLQQSEIFNYFAHYNITLPPLHWKIACKRAQTKCIGTFIIQHPVYAQETLFSQQFALFLIAIARAFEFDGYLINIETKIKDVSSLIKWLGILTNRIHQYIPNSVIIWYDSVSAANGQIIYQNCLNQANLVFFNASDGIFTNYWWKDQLLNTSIQKKGNSPNKVYIGNDCFGRGTYGGGKYDIYKAANKILEYKASLSIALFAPGFTYEDNAQYNRQLFQIHELAMYKGFKFGTMAIDKWQIIDNGGNGWNQEAQWAVTSYSVCRRRAIMVFNPLQQGKSAIFQFIVDVGSTGVMTNSPYKIVLQLVNDSGAIVSQTGSYQFVNISYTTDTVQTQTYKIQITQELVGNKGFTVRIFQIGQSKLAWAGHFGPRFRYEKAYMLTYEKERHWINKVPVNNINIGSQYHTLCNLGMGNFFSNLGIKKQQFYNYLADYDLPQTHVINSPMQTQINYNDSYIGGTSLLVRRPVIKLLKVLIPKDIDLKKRYYTQIVVKDTKSINVVLKYISKNDEERIFNASIKNIEQVGAGWKRFTFELINNQKIVSSDIRSIIDITSSDIPYSIGSIKIISSDNLPTQPVIGTISISRDYVPTTTYYLNVRLRSSDYKRVLVSIENYSSLCYFVNGEGCMYNVFIPRTNSIKIKIVDIDNGLQQKTICQKVIQGPLMSQLIFKGSIDL